MSAGVVVVIPAFNEEQALGKVLAAIPDGVANAVVVANNGSTDDTRRVALDGGAVVVDEPRRGYGYACLAGIEKARDWDPETIVFLDGDFSDYPEQMERLVGPIADGACDFVVGSRMRGKRSRGALLPQARFGNWLAGSIMRLVWGAGFTDLGPFRAIRLDAVDRLDMQDRTYGWTVEMQLKAVEAGLRWIEVPVDYRPRIGVSKVTGTVRGTVGASFKILRILFSYAVTRGARTNSAEEGDLAKR
jgi:hypothetical protein